jgi:high-affinity iron transporter
MQRLRHLPALVVVMLLAAIGIVPVHAQENGPEEALRTLNAHVERALSLAQAGDLAGASTAFEQFRTGWFQMEDGVRAKSRDAYGAIEDAMGDARYALGQGDAAKALTALETLRATNARFIAGEFAAGTPPATAGVPDLATLVGHLDAARAALARNDLAAAQTDLAAFQAIWPDVEGQVKVRSADVYSAIESDMAQAAALLRANDGVGAGQVLARMHADLTPLLGRASYGIFDAAAILLREGMEALLVIAALVAFLKRSGNGDKRRWIWAGGLLGVLASVLTAVVLTLIFRGLATGSNRELIEGLTGLVAAGMLFYVSYWLHSKSQMGAWQQYIRARTSAALATGSLFSLALLAFLAVFREGAETALFYIGIASSITLADLLMGFGLATAALVVVGALIFWAGVRVPLRPFFLVTSSLIFYLGFKFVGTGIHALQIAGVVPASPAAFLPEVELLGLYPTWETTVPQVLLLAGAALVYALSRRAARARLVAQNTPVTAAE